MLPSQPGAFAFPGHVKSTSPRHDGQGEALRFNTVRRGLSVDLRRL